ncbi:hypothetical protein [Winogradskya humida]|uniref:Uncharacterized protein n=1 Tax=Winogradskya humida TaxID=113566 RepID=A0ABQ4A1G2_9ACTN|nr:hypothetical protein [Actinoplanes humidus]GIE24458.1 hypothetical protein Ahu01nite_075600 [Actinoplanes humidus]
MDGRIVRDLRERSARWADEGDTSAVLGSDVNYLIEAVTSPNSGFDPDAAYAVAMICWARYRILGPRDGFNALARALRLFDELHRRGDDSAGEPPAPVRLLFSYADER